MPSHISPQDPLSVCYTLRLNLFRLCRRPAATRLTLSCAVALWALPSAVYVRTRPNSACAEEQVTGSGDWSAGDASHSLVGEIFKIVPDTPARVSSESLWLQSLSNWSRCGFLEMRRRRWHFQAIQVKQIIFGGRKFCKGFFFFLDMHGCAFAFL